MILVVGLMVLIVFQIVNVLHIKQTTGTLNITTFADDSVISIGQNNKTPQVVGVGNVKIRMIPGPYQIVASNAGSTTFAQATVRLQATTSIHLAKTRTTPVPSPDNITFRDINALNNYGITTDQSANLRTLFFKYKPTARTITITARSIASGPHNPDSDDPFTLTFVGTIDGTDYTATLTYSGTQDLELTLNDPQTGTQLFDASSAQSAPDN